MDMLIHIFRDVLDGPLYWIVVIVCVLLIFTILGYLLDRSSKSHKELEMISNTPNAPAKVDFSTAQDSSLTDSVIDGTRSDAKMDKVIDFNDSSSQPKLEEELTTPKETSENIIVFSESTETTMKEKIPEVSVQNDEIDRDNASDFNAEDVIDNTGILEINSTTNTDEEDKLILTSGDK